MITELFQPAGDILVSLVLGDVVDKEGTDSATVVCAGDSAVALLAGGIPDLGLDGLVVDLDAAGGELDADGGLAVEVEFVSGETREKVGFTNTGVSNEDHLEEEIVLVVGHDSGIAMRGVVGGRWRGQTQRRSGLGVVYALGAG